MRKSVHSEGLAAFGALLRQIREEAGLNQADLGKRLRKHQSFVAKIEGGERRVDVIEFIEISKALDQDPVGVLRRLLRSGI